MKFLLSLLFVVSIFLLSLSYMNHVNAESPIGEACSGADASICKEGDSDPLTGESGLIMKATAVLSYIIGFVAVLMIVIAGMKFVTSNGNPEAVASARNTIIYALVGVVIAASSQLIIRFVLNLI